MTAPLRHKFQIVLMLGVFVFTPVLRAQPPALPGAPKVDGSAKTPPLPVMKSPVDSFRELLAKTPAEREQALTNRPPEVRRRILAKVNEYEVMKPEERELRLRSTQLRWYVLFFMRTPLNQRAAQLATLPEADRKMISNHLKNWDELPVVEQQKILMYEQTLENLANQRLEGAAATNIVIAAVSAPARQDALANLENFLKLPADQREQMYASFQRFFELTDDEKQKTIGALPADQRQHMAAAFEMMKRLPQTERAEYLKGLKICLSMNDPQRDAFMKNAESWRKLSPAQRQAWRTLINGLPAAPPLPPNFVYPPHPQLPPLPLQVNGPVGTNSTQ